MRVMVEVSAETLRALREATRRLGKYSILTEAEYDAVDDATRILQSGRS